MKLHKFIPTVVAFVLVFSSITSVPVSAASTAPSVETIHPQPFHQRYRFVCSPTTRLRGFPGPRNYRQLSPWEICKPH